MADITISEAKQAVEDIKTAFHKFKEHKEGEHEKLAQYVKGLEAKMNRLALGGGGLGSPGGIDREKPEIKALAHHMRTGDRLSAMEAKALSIDVAPSGGWLVPPDVNDQIALTERDACPLRQVANVITVDNEGYEKLLSPGGFVANAVGERQARPETATGSLVKVAPSFVEIYAEPAITQKLLDDSAFDVVKWLTGELGLAFGAKESAMFATGSGVQSARGILTYTLNSGTPAFGELKQIKSGTNAVITPDTLYDCIFALKPGYRRNAVWMMNGLTIAALRKLKDTTNNYLFKDDGPKKAGEAGTLLGYPVYEWADLPAPGNGSNSILFGDFSRGYVIADHRTGTRILRDPLTNKGFVLFYTTKRTGGGVEDSNAIVVYTLGP